MSRVRPVRSFLRALAVLVCVLGAPAGAQAPASPPPAAPGAKLEEIQETTVGTLSGVDVGVANMWDREYVDGAGVTRTGLTARLDYELGGVTQRVFVGEGSIVTVGNARWEVVRLVKTPGQNGHVTLRPLTP